ncbi:MAG: DegV family protein [Acutalibacteraceae bacterium]|jgi:DegV family protein with EDD domain
MRPFAILADSTCDLGEAFQKKYRVDVIPGHVVLPDKTEILSHVRWEHFTREEFYAGLKKDPDGYATSPANVAEFSAAFEEYAQKGEDVLCMTISGGISGTFDFATMAAKEVTARHPDMTVRCVDTRRFGPGFGLMTLYASRLREEGKSLEETVAWLEENKNRFHQAGWLDDLSFVAKKGRLTHAKAFFGALAGVKPIGEFDYNGLTTVIGKIKGAKAAYAALLTYIERTIEDPGEQIVFIAQTNRLPQAEEYKRLIEERFHPKAVYINDVHTACGVNVGPGLMAAYYCGKPISKDLEEERAILEQATRSAQG